MVKARWDGRYEIPGVVGEDINSMGEEVGVKILYFI